MSKKPVKSPPLSERLQSALADGSVVRMVEGVRPEMAELAAEISLAARRPAAAGAAASAEPAGPNADLWAETRLAAPLARLAPLIRLACAALSWLAAAGGLLSELSTVLRE